MGTIADWWFGRNPTQTTEDFHFDNASHVRGLAPLLVDPRLLSGSSSSDAALVSLPTLFRGVQILEDNAAALPWFAQRGGLHSDQAQMAVPEVIDPTPMILVKPSPFDTRNEVIRRIISQLIWRGNAYLWLTGHDPSTNKPTVAIPINPDEVDLHWKDNDSRHIIKEYVWRDVKMTEGFDLLHIPLMPMVGQPGGLGPIDSARINLGYGLDIKKFAGEFFKGSATPAGALSHPGRLDKEEAENLREQWELQHAAGRGTAVLSGGLTYTPISITPEQAQFIATQSLSNQQIATLLGIPQHMLNAGQPQGTASSLTYANLGMVMEELYRTISTVYITRIEEAFTRLLPRGQSVRFDPTELLRTDNLNRWTAFGVALDKGILTRDEVRQMEGRPPLPDSAFEVTSSNPNPFEIQQPEPDQEDEEDEGNGAFPAQPADRAAE